MAQTTIDMLQVISANANVDPVRFMDGMLAFERELVAAIAQAKSDLTAKSPPKDFVPVLHRLAPHGMRYGAVDLLGIGDRCITSHFDLNGHTDASRADIMVWIAIAQQTRIALGVLFQCCLLFGASVNGKPLPEVRR